MSAVSRQGETALICWTQVGFIMGWLVKFNFRLLNTEIVKNASVYLGVLA